MNNHNMNMHHGVATQEAHKPLVGKNILLICLAVVAVAITAVTVFRVSVGSLFYIAAFAACPLMHILMMRGGGHKHER